MKTFRSYPKPTSSPWGTVQGGKELLPGIWTIYTASHGGLWLSDERLDEMPEGMQETPYSLGPWFEEDCDWALVAAIYPDAFTDQQHQRATDTLRWSSQMQAA